MGAERDPQAWLIEKVRARWSQYDIERELSEHHSISQSTISRNFDRIMHGQDLTRRMRTAILALFAHEAKQDARIDADQMALIQLFDALDEWQEFNVYEAEQAILLQERLEAAENDFRVRQNAVRRRASVVNRMMQDRGIVETGSTYVYGDGAALIQEGAEDFAYHETSAEILGYAPAEHVFPGGWTARQLRHGVSREQRMQPSAVPAEQPRPAMIGIRKANLIPHEDYVDSEWFWGHLASTIKHWYALRDSAPEWRASGLDIPRNPTYGDIAWYRKTLQLETECLQVGLIFEESILGWTDDWGAEVEEKRNILRSLEKRRRLIDAASTSGRIALWSAGCIATIALIWFFIRPIFIWVTGKIVAGIGAIVQGVVTAYHDAVYAVAVTGDWIGHTTGLIVSSPLTLLGLVSIFIFAIKVCPQPAPGQNGATIHWVMGIAATVGLIIMIRLLFWLLSGLELLLNNLKTLQ